MILIIFGTDLMTFGQTHPSDKTGDSHRHTNLASKCMNHS